jgi:hypothetical protein
VRLVEARAAPFRPEELVTNPSRPFVLCVLLASAGAAAASPAGAASPAANAAANPYSFYGSVAECAAAQRDRCAACLAAGSCTAITNGNGNAECMRLTANGGRGEFLICINLALAIDAVTACAASRAPSCPRDTGASQSLSSLEANASFLDDPACAAPLDACLAALYGPPGSGFPGPGSGGSASPRPRSTSIGCDDSFSGDPNCDASPDCELDGPSCDAPEDGACEDSNEQSGCSDSGGGDGEGGGDCSSSGDGGDCSSGDGGDCSSGDGGDCSGGGGGADCSSSGGGGDCSGGGGGGECNAGGRRGRSGMGLPVAIAWALLPIPFATIVRRRAERRRARAEYDAEPNTAPDAQSSDGGGAA